MSSRGAREETVRAAERAAQWLDALEHGEEQVRRDFASWLCAAPMHVQEFLLMSALAGELERIDPDRRMDVTEILARSSAGVVHLQSEPVRPKAAVGSRRPGRMRWIAGVAAACAVAAGTLWWVQADRNVYATSVGEQRRIQLTDGSVVHLNAASRVQIDFTDSARQVRLLAGEALFKVGRDATRPFRVYAGSNLIEALGTEFNVLRRPSAVTVSVLEGIVQVAQTQVRSGEEVRIGSDGSLSKRVAPDPEQLAAWQQGRLVFRDETLEDIVAEFNRYNRYVRVRLAAAESGSRRYTAVFDADDPQSLIEFLEREAGLTVQRRGSEYFITAD